MIMVVRTIVITRMTPSFPSAMLGAVSVLASFVAGGVMLGGALLGAIVILALLMALAMLVGLLLTMLLSVGIGVFALVTVVVYLVRVWTLNEPAVQQHAKAGAGEAAPPRPAALDAHSLQAEASHRVGDHVERHP